MKKALSLLLALVTVALTLYHATIAAGIPKKLEHNDIRWVTIQEIDQLPFCPADVEILKKIQEVKNAYAAYEQIGKFDIYNLEDFKRLHGIMTKYIEDESGSFRKGEEGVFNGDKCIFMAPPARFVHPASLKDFLRKFVHVSLPKLLSPSHSFSGALTSGSVKVNSVRPSWLVTEMSSPWLQISVLTM